jgi:hypothetical protein
VGGDVSVNRETFLMTDFVNFKIKLTQFFKCAHRSRVCTCVYRGEFIYIYEYLRLYKNT